MIYAIIGLILSIALFAVYRNGRNSAEKDELQRNVSTGEIVNEILKKQRDNRIGTVDGADSLFDSLKKD